MKSLLIENALIVDGTGNEPFLGTVAIKNEKIEDVVPYQFSPDVKKNFDEIIDAQKNIVSPGFIDSHAHSDAYLILEPDAPSKTKQGITTEINGQCGGSASPRYGEARLSSDWAALLGEKLTWRSVSEYRNVLEKNPPAINTIQFIGHNTLRASVVGYEGRFATLKEIATMQDLLVRSLDEGGWGLSTGLIYQPGKYSSNEEVEALARTAAEKGALYATHMKSEGDELLESIDEVIALARNTGIKAEISHLKTSGKRNWHKIDAAIEKIDNAVNEGILLGCDRYPFCAAGTDLDVVFPDWAGEGGAVSEMQRLLNPSTKKRIAEELDSLDRDWAEVVIGGTWHTHNKDFSGKSIKHISEELKKSPGNAIVEILTLDECKTGAFFFSMCERNLNKILACPWVVPGSDASLRAPWGALGNDFPHPRAYATMPQYFKVMKSLGFSTVECVRRMTSLPATRFGIKNRGVVRKGNFADIIVWREDDFSSKASYANPHIFADGILHVIVNGELTIKNGSFTGKRAGKFLER
jgi:N-acyl-D-amino-acid deacylase